MPATLISTQARWLAGENLTGDTLSDVALAYYSTHTKDFVRVHKAYYYAAKIAATNPKSPCHCC